MTKRVILFGPLPPPYGGVSVFLNALRAHMKGFNVRLWTLYGDRASDPEITYLNHRRLGVIPLLMREGHKARIVDFTHFHLEYPNLVLLPIWLAAKRVVRFEWFKVVLDGSLPRRYQRFHLIQRLLFKLGIHSVNEFIVVSDDLRCWLQDTIKVKRPVTLVRSLLNIPSETLKHHLSIKTEGALAPFLSHPKRVCSSGIFIPSYGFKHVVEAVEKIRCDLGVDIGVVLIDGAFASEEGYRDQVLGGRDWVTVLTNVPNPEVYQILKECDVFVRAFEFESYGISRIEAIWCGVPVIATRAGETRGMLTYDFGDTDRLTQLIREVLFDPPDYQLGEWADKYRQEADENLRILKNTIGVSPAG